MAAKKDSTSASVEDLDPPLKEKSYTVTLADGRRQRVKGVYSYRKDGSGVYFFDAAGNDVHSYSDGQVKSVVDDALIENLE